MPRVSGRGILLALQQLDYTLYGEWTFPSRVSPYLVKIKVAHTRLPSVGFRSWSQFLAVSLQVTWIINPGGRAAITFRQACSYLKRAATNFAAWWTDARWVWAVCLRLLPDSVATAIWTLALLRLSPAAMHANHSATEPPWRTAYIYVDYAVVMLWMRM